MCHFITATLPKTAPIAALDALARKLGRQFRPLANPAVLAQLPSGSAYFFTTLSHCDCDTAMGSASRAAARAPDWGQEKAKLVKKGWSAAKISRAMEQRQQSDLTKQVAQEKADRSLPASLEGFVSGILASGLTPEVGLLLHDYRGDLDEEFKISNEQVPIGTELASVLPSAQEDVLYIFRARA